MKVKCKQCGRTTDKLIDGRFCSNSCKKFYIKKLRINWIKKYRKK